MQLELFFEEIDLKTNKPLKLFGEIQYVYYDELPSDFYTSSRYDIKVEFH